ncbi:hypothetical protein AN958_00882 [Leucoagaricus sp. SymC.cos]|nr:hypothetical protein AN958_00882 [Leucoagaricus sp. SymC.cos]
MMISYLRAQPKPHRDGSGGAELRRERTFVDKIGMECEDMLKRGTQRVIIGMI